MRHETKFATAEISYGSWRMQYTEEFTVQAVVEDMLDALDGKRIGWTKGDTFKLVNWQGLPMESACLHGLASKSMFGVTEYIYKIDPRCPVQKALAQGIREIDPEFETKKLKEEFGPVTLVKSMKDSDIIPCWNDEKERTEDDIRLLLKHVIITEQMKDEL